MAKSLQDGHSVSVAENLFELDTHTVKLKIHIENHTDQELELVDKFKSAGEWGEIPQRVSPGKKESLFCRKTSDTATGKYQCQLGYGVYSSVGQNNYYIL